MTAKSNIEEKLEELGRAISSDGSIVENVMNRIKAKSLTGPHAGKAQNIWRKIRKTRIAKLASAAAVIILLVLLNRGRDHVLWADVSAAFKRVDCVHIFMRFTNEQEGKVIGTEQCWIRKPNLYRHEKSITTGNVVEKTVIIDNGVEKLELDKKAQTAQFSESLQDILPGPMEMLLFVKFFREPDTTFAGVKFIVSKIRQECTREELAFDVKVLPASGLTKAQDQSKCKIWADKKTLLIRRVHISPKYSGLKDASLRYVFDYPDIDPNMFSFNIPEGYTELPKKVRPVVSGVVQYPDGSPVADAKVHIRGFPFHHLRKCRTDEAGRFEAKGDYCINLRFPIRLCAFPPDSPDLAAWTIITDPEPWDKEDDYPDFPVPECGNVELVIDPNGRAFKCERATGIVLTMEPALQITGTVTDQASQPIAGSKVRVISLKYKRASLGWATYLLEITDSRGRYKLTNQPVCRGAVSLTLSAEADGYIPSEKEVLLDGSLVYEGVDFDLCKAKVGIK